MKFFNKFGWLVVWVFFFGWGSMIVLAAPPLPTATPSASAGSNEPGAAQPASAVIEIAGATRLADLPPVSDVEVSAQQTEAITSTMFSVAYDGQHVKVVPDSVVSEAQDELSLASTSQATIITSENFESSIDPLFVTQLDTNSADGLYRWSLVNCYSTPGFPTNQSVGNRSLWPAASEVAGSPSLNPCSQPPQNYPRNLDVSFYYGPFDLSDAQDASLEFFYRLDIPDPDDFFFWGASLDGVNFHGQTISGSYAAGPFPNRHNFVSFDLTNVPTLGDLSGQSQVWIAFRFVSDGDTETGAGPFVDAISLRKNTAPKRKIISESFTDTFPTGYVSWLSHDNNGDSGGNQRWGSADCFARSDSKSMWMASYGLNGINPSVGIDPCTAPNFDALKNQTLDSWLIYGPFNLEGVSEAWLDFYFRGDAEFPPGGVITKGDIINWWASTDGSDYFGQAISGGPLTAGPEGNGYNRMRFDLSNVTILGDLRGESTVWLAFVFQSDGDDQIGTTGEGFFVDDAELVVIDRNLTSSVFLPLVTKSEFVVPVGGITFENFTGNPVILELIGLGQRTFSSDSGPHVWDNISAGIYDWILSGTCPKGAGQIGSQIDGRPRVEIKAGTLDNPINPRDDGSVNVFDCSG